MKRKLVKVVFSLVMILLLNSCAYPSGVATSESGNKNIKVYKYHYNNHDYLEFAIGPYGEGGVVHDPDCQCYQK